MRIWTERPAKTDVEAVVRCYFGLLRAGRIPEAEQLIDHSPVRHVLKSLWTGSVGAGADGDGASRSAAADEWERDLSWLGELGPADFHWGDTGAHLYVEITCRAQMIEVALGFWVKPVDAGWVIAGPSTLW
ncbi:hypothetical protein [Streptomyces sp. WAC08241]|uniref:hypothetical protein n=1 Tax=Streptomyces sp. WAC08241 TaxID=2487421 RepID=UPI000F7B3107|nr:hypothetical protein [Streptomyces sp. WAC08241]RSS47107.1 hypothetical protein EF906_00215 [Streptomyces sp. WAC08241]